MNSTNLFASHVAQMTYRKKAVHLLNCFINPTQYTMLHFFNRLTDSIAIAVTAVI